jgi:8-oxo-dGTP pyrophosphatase MutT (NUDIX family)
MCMYADRTSVPVCRCACLWLLLWALGRPDWADKIAAVRETFEESGILLVRPAERMASVSPADLATWRKHVHADASQFVRLCTAYGVQPALAALHPWSVWVTPTIEPKRFFTRFYLALLPAVPTHARHDNVESMTTDWFSPEQGPVARHTVALTYTHTHIHTFIHTHTHTRVHTYIHTPIHTYMHTH